MAYRGDTRHATAAVRPVRATRAYGRQVPPVASCRRFASLAAPPAGVATALLPCPWHGTPSSPPGKQILFSARRIGPIGPIGPRAGVTMVTRRHNPAPGMVTMVTRRRNPGPQ